MGLNKLPLCVLKGHKLTEHSIINFIDSSNWLKKCDRCGLYLAHSDRVGTLIVTEKKAHKLKQEFEDEFPYSIKKGLINDGK